MDTASVATQLGITASIVKSDRQFFIDQKPIPEFVADAALAANAEAKAAAGAEPRGAAVRAVA